MNKKGAISWEVVIFLIVAAFVLFLILLSVGGRFNWNFLPNIIPSFGKNPSEVNVDAEVLKYSLVDESMNYYDGTNWIPISGKDCKITLNDKIFSCDLSDNFNSYYFEDYSSLKSKRADIISDSLPAVKWKNGNSADIIIKDISPHTSIALRKNLIAGFFSSDLLTIKSYVRFTYNGVDYYLDYNNQIYYRSLSDNSGEYDKGSWESAFDQVKKWRDSVLNNKIDIYYTLSGGAIVDLSCPVEKNKGDGLAVRIDNCGVKK